MLQLNYRDARPIYEQVKDGLRKLVISGAIAPDEKLPSVRSLASSLAINPNTIQHAYEALEREGYVYTVTGRGTFAAPQSDVGEERRAKLLAAFEEAVGLVKLCNEKLEDAEQKVRILTASAGGEITDLPFAVNDDEN